MSDYIEERIQQYRYQVAHRMIIDGRFSFEKIAEIVNITVEEVIEVSKHPEYFKD